MKRFILLIGLMLFSISLFSQTKFTSVDVNLRKSPGVKGNKICNIPKGTEVSIVQFNTRNNNWVKINYKGIEGFVNGKYLKDASLDTKIYHKGKTYNKSVKHYKELKVKPHSNKHYNSVPAGACAECNDGTYSYSQNRRGTCSHHGGVKRWL